MLVSKDNQNLVLSKFIKKGGYALDTETTGLRPFHGDRMFSLILSNASEAFYFNFINYPGLEDKYILNREEVCEGLSKAFAIDNSVWFLSNAKFDLHMLSHHMDVDIAGRIHDVVVAGRILFNQHMKYGLDAQLKRIGKAKNDTVKEYIKKHKLSTKIEVPGKKTKVTVPHYDKVPIHIIRPYGEDDAKDTRYLAMIQIDELRQNKANEAYGKTNQADVYDVECEVTKALFDMEQRGIKVDTVYIKEALDYYQVKKDKLLQTWEDKHGTSFIDSGKYLKYIFGLQKSYDEDFMRYVRPDHLKADSDLVLEIRECSKKLSTYFQGFLYHKDENDVIHTDYQQTGTNTLRMSSREPNLQNISKNKDKGAKYPIRRCFIPRPDHCFVMIDYKQMEYRLLLDLADEKKLIAQVKLGMDIHTATGEQMGIDRDKAKTQNFGIVYGQGNLLMARKMGVSQQKAKELKREYFRKLPGVCKFIETVTNVAKTRREKYVKSWAGMRYYFKESRFAYKSPNHTIQGGCATIVKKAMNGCRDRIKEEPGVHMLLQVHDELVFEIHKDSLHVVKDLADIMKKAYPYKKLPMDVDIEHSWVSWHDKVDGLPIGEKMI